MSMDGSNIVFVGSEGPVFLFSAYVLLSLDGLFIERPQLSRESD